MIIWHEKMSVTSDIRGRFKDIKKKIEKPEKLKWGAYLITLCDNGVDLLEIYDILYFPSKHFSGKDYDITVVGAAGDKVTAEQLAGDIIAGIYNETGGFDVKKWFSQNK